MARRVGQPDSWGTSLVLAALAVVVQLVFVERGLSYDEGAFLAMGDALADGQILYLDRPIFVAPLGYELVGLLFRLFEPHILVGRLYVIAGFSLVVFFVHRVCLVVLPPQRALLAALAVFPIKALDFPFWTVMNYTQVALPFKMAAIWATACWFQRRTPIWLIVAGGLVGLTVVTKQDYGAYVSVGIAFAILFDWMLAPDRRAKTLVVALGSVVISAIVPVLAFVLYYALAGAVRAFLSDVVLNLAHVPGGYSVPMPRPRWWSDSGDLFMSIFSYLPTVFLEASWAGRMNVFDPQQLVPLEIVVKVLYYLPWLAMPAVLVSALRGRAMQSRTERSTTVLVTAIGIVGYALMFRADWTHLMNLYTVMILPITFFFGRLFRPMVAKAVAAFFWALWMGFGGFTAYAVCTTFDTAVATPRGRIVDVPRVAADVRTVLDYVQSLPADRRVLFMPYSSLFYFLTNRPILAPNEMILPGLIVGESDDLRLARATAAADLVVYNPKVIPTVPVPLHEFAPHTAEMLVSHFSFEEALSDTAIVLRRKLAKPSVTKVDFWENPGRHPPDDSTIGTPRRLHWAMYKTVALDLSNQGEERCFGRNHCVSAGEVLELRPTGHPDGWGVSTDHRIRFDLRIRRTTGAESSPYTMRKNSADGPRVDMLPLHQFEGECVTLLFCARAEDGGIPHNLAGWAEPRIVVADP